MVNEAVVFEALLDWNLWGTFKEKIKKREKTPKVQKGLILVIKGVRRSGKSMLSYMLANNFKPKESLVINFEDPRLKGVRARDIMKIVEVYQRKVSESLPKLIILDEVQNVTGWEKVAKLYSEAKKVNIVVTGSSSKLMSEEYATVLTGRHIDFELFPLSFREALSWKNIAVEELEIYKHKMKVLRVFDTFINFGGFPKVLLIREKREKTALLREYFNDIIIKDIVRRFRVKRIDKLEDLARIYLTNISTLQSLNKLKTALNISLDSVERFSKYFEIARLFFFVPKFSYSVRQQIVSVKKVYCVDTGFFSALGFRFMGNIGRLMENLVAIELFRRKSYWHNDWDIYYWRDYAQHEVDFVIKEGINVSKLIQVTYASARDEIEKREIRSLLKASELLKCRDLICITWDYEATEEIKGKKIKFIPLWKFLLNLSGP